MAGKPGMKSELPTTLPTRFSRDWPWAIDRRTVLAREIAADLGDFYQDLGGLPSLSVMERVLVERAVFLRRRILDHERAVLAGAAGTLTPNEHTAAINALLGVLKALGLKRKARDAGSLAEWLRASETAPEAAGEPLDAEIVEGATDG
jgi:hypothetical protein